MTIRFEVVIGLLLVLSTTPALAEDVIKTNAPAESSIVSDSSSVGFTCSDWRGGCYYIEGGQQILAGEVHGACDYQPWICNPRRSPDDGVCYTNFREICKKYDCYFKWFGGCRWGELPESEDECKQMGCNWTNGTCECPMPGPVPNPVAECEQNPNCRWTDGQCLCTMPNPEQIMCETDPNCRWADGQCLCTISPEQLECEMDPNCHWSDGECICTEPSPEEPMPGPVPNPVEDCEANPNCHWADGQCLCTGMMQ